MIVCVESLRERKRERERVVVLLLELPLPPNIKEKRCFVFFPTFFTPLPTIPTVEVNAVTTEGRGFRLYSNAIKLVA
jgi:hypothetical protein